MFDPCNKTEFVDAKMHLSVVVAGISDRAGKIRDFSIFLKTNGRIPCVAF
jgi:hypothetical protein